MNKVAPGLALKYLSLLIFILLFWACEGENSTVTTASKRIGNYKMEVVDSIILNELSPVMLKNYNDLTDELLLENRQMGEISIMNGQGDIISRFKPYVEGPDYTENANYGWTFAGRDGLIAYGQAYFHRLTKAGDRIERIPYPMKVRMWVTRDFNPQNIFFLDNDDSPEILAIVPGATGKFKQSSQAYMDSVQKVHAINIETKEHRALPGIPAMSDYRTMGAYADRGTPIMNRFKGNLFASVYEVDSKIYLHDMTTGELIKTLEIPAEHHPEYKPVPFGSKQFADVARKNATVFSTGDRLVISNIGEIPNDEMKVIMDLPQWWESPEMEAAIEKYMTSNYLVFDQEGYLGTLDYKSIGPFDMNIIGSQNGYFWVKRNYEDERDYQTLLKVQLVRAD